MQFSLVALSFALAATQTHAHGLEEYVLANDEFDQSSMSMSAGLFFATGQEAIVGGSGRVQSQGSKSGKPYPTVEIQILSVSDWHGQLDPKVLGPLNNLTGGAAVLSAYWKADRIANNRTLTLTAGDAVGGTPPLSNFFNDTPAILAMNLMGFDADTFGNHNFDAGIARLQSQIDLAEFRYVSANLKNRDAALTGVKSFKIFNVGGVKVAVIGITNPEAPTLVFPGNFGGIVPTDPVKAAMKARSAAKKAGARVFVILAHMGVTGFYSNGTAFGPLIEFANNVGGFDVIIGDHTDFLFSGTINNALVYENLSKGISYARVKLTVELGRHRRVASKSMEFVTPYASAVEPDAEIDAMLAPYRTNLTKIFSEVLGNSTVAIPRSDACGVSNGRKCESLVGDLTSDSLRTTYGTDFAIVNSGGLRDALTCSGAITTVCPAFSPPPYAITSGQAFSLLPFGNVAVTFSLTGAELKTMLEHGVSLMPSGNGRFPQISGLCFTYNITASAGSRVQIAFQQAANGTCSNVPIDLTAATTYSVTTADFIAVGGDGYPNFASRMVTRDTLFNVLSDYVRLKNPISPLIQGRIVCTGDFDCPLPA
jgi:5'-nucleotidase